MSDLRDELVKYVFDHYYAVPAADRARSHWVMDPEWLDDLRAGVLDAPPPGTILTLVGLPVRLRKGAGPPRLELP